MSALLVASVVFSTAPASRASDWLPSEESEAIASSWESASDSDLPPEDSDSSVEPETAEIPTDLYEDAPDDFLAEPDDAAPEDVDQEQENGYAQYQGPSFYSISGSGGVGKAYIQEKLILMLYGGRSGQISCDYDGYSSIAGRHEGIDFVQGRGAAIYSLTAGKVIRITNGADNETDLSTIAIYDADNDKTVIYLHCTPSEHLDAGMMIAQGEFLGLESSRGASIDHTHVEVADGYTFSAKYSVNDAILENSDPYYYWAKILSNTLGICSVRYDDTAARCDGVAYQTLQAALDAAQEGQTVTMVQDLSESVVIQTPEITLDLDGNTLTAGNGQGILRVQAPNVTIQNGTLTGERITYALYAGGHSQSEDGTYVPYDASGLQVEDLSIADVSLADGGSFIAYVESWAENNRQISFTRVSIRNCTGAILGAWANTPVLFFDQCDFSENETSGDMIRFASSNVLIHDSIIEKNAGTENGAILSGPNTNLLLSSVTVAENQGRYVGGLAFSGSHLILMDTVVKDNLCGEGVSGICMASGKLSISGGAIYDNQLESGRGIDIYIGYDAIARIPPASLMQDDAVDFSRYVWYRYNNNRLYQTTVAIPGGLTAIEAAA